MTMSPDCFPSMRSLQVPSDHDEWWKFTRYRAFFFSLPCVIHPSVHNSFSIYHLALLSVETVCLSLVSQHHRGCVSMNHGKCRAQTASKLLNNRQPVLAWYWPASPLSHLPLLHLSRLSLQFMQLCACTCLAMGWMYLTAFSDTHTCTATHTPPQIHTPWVK